jgi:hypothetical protein
MSRRVSYRAVGLLAAVMIAPGAEGAGCRGAGRSKPFVTTW